MSGKDDDLELVRGSDNPFRDFDLPDADVENLKTELAVEIIAVLNRRGLTTRQAGKLVGMDQADISRIRNGDLRRFTIDKLVTVLNRLDRRVEVKIHKVQGTAAA